MSGPEFFYDFNSPYAYLTAQRIDELIPDVTWTPVAFGVIVKQTAKTPWSFAEASRAVGQATIARRAQVRGLLPVVYPAGWPKGSYSLTPLRAALVADDAGRLREFSLALYRSVFADGRSPGDLDVILDAAAAAGVDADAVRAGVEDDDVKARLRATTDAALARGIDGVPTVTVGEQLFWGDDRLEDAAAATRALRPS
jgi:2-hydroxychromene-2-carboxylate isomerase